MIDYNNVQFITQFDQVADEVMETYLCVDEGFFSSSKINIMCTN